MRRCPKCGTIDDEHASQCGVCGADLWGTKSQSLAEAVREEETFESLKEKRMGEVELAAVRLEARLSLVLYISLVGAIIFGICLLLFIQGWPSTLGLVLILAGVVVLWAIAGKSPFGRRRTMFETLDS